VYNNFFLESVSTEENAYEEINVGKTATTTGAENAKVKSSQPVQEEAKKRSKKSFVASNGNAKPGIVSKSSIKQSAFGETVLKPLLTRNRSVDGTETTKLAPKVRISPRLRRNNQKPTQEVISENSNNSNARPIVPLKPKNIVQDTLKRGTNKILVTMNDALGVPKPIAKNNKKLIPDVSELFSIFTLK